MAKKRGCLLSYSPAGPGRELTQHSPCLLAKPCSFGCLTFPSTVRMSYMDSLRPKMRSLQKEQQINTQIAARVRLPSVRPFRPFSVLPCPVASLGRRTGKGNSPFEPHPPPSASVASSNAIPQKKQIHLGIDGVQLDWMMLCDHLVLRYDFTACSSNSPKRLNSNMHHH